LERCAVSSGCRWIKQEAGEFLGCAKLPNSSGSVKNPRVMHVPTGKRASKRLKGAGLTKDAVR